MNFNPIVDGLEQQSVEDIRAIIANQETATFFLGRTTCPYCHRFAQTLATVLEETTATVYFVPSDNVEDAQNLQEFRQTYNIPTVPAFIHIENGELQVRCDSSMTAEEIKSFAHL
ncbi:conjugal transfer protein TraF [Streptococcus himalayensis]|uniref:Thiol reductase thioredoxin n=1 Tax=Streptococcus himalayensis TaxID=1888195 RepID=A0A917A5J1_9STRE|nr:conjugal transfer protein TraF [Streptococcus himalayensis]GGE28585.1 thiol reductase thioredoxin [Streptococcus himalayensis]